MHSIPEDVEKDLLPNNTRVIGKLRNVLSNVSDNALIGAVRKVFSDDMDLIADLIVK